jgi:hypothetical protein
MVPESIALPAIRPENPVVARCRAAYDRAYILVIEAAKLDKKGRITDYDARDQGRLAYRESMPCLDTRAHIRDFLACVIYAQLTGIMLDKDANSFINAAVIALRTVRDEPPAQ